MSFSSKRIVTSMIAGVFWVIAYIIYALGANAPESNDLQGWALTMLCFIGISVIVATVIQIFFHIAVAIGIAIREHEQGHTPDKNVEREISSQMLEDEMGKLINLKA